MLEGNFTVIVGVNQLFMKIQLTIFFLFISSWVVAQENNFDNIKALYKQGKFKDAIELCTSELSKYKQTDSMYKKILRYRVDCYADLLNYDSAILDWKSLIKLNPKEAEYYSGISYVYWDLKLFDSSLFYIQKGYNLCPNDALLLSNMAYYYAQYGMYEDCIRYATEGLNQKSLSTYLMSLLFNNRGFAYIKLNQYKKGLSDIEQSIKLYPDNSFAYCYRALANIKLKRMETVCTDLEKAKSLGAVNLTKDLLNEYCTN